MSGSDGQRVAPIPRMTSRNRKAVARGRSSAAVRRPALPARARRPGSWAPAPRLFESALDRVDRRVQGLILRSAPRIEGCHAGAPLRVVRDPEIFDRYDPTGKYATGPST